MARPLVSAYLRAGDLARAKEAVKVLRKLSPALRAKLAGKLDIRRAQALQDRFWPRQPMQHQSHNDEPSCFC